MRWRRQTRRASRGELMELAHRLTAVDERQARRLAASCLDNGYAARARARVLSPGTPGVADLLAALDVLATGFPLSRDTEDGARGYAAAADLLIATHGRAELRSAERLTLSLAAVHALDPLGT